MVWQNGSNFFFKKIPFKGITLMHEFSQMPWGGAEAEANINFYGRVVGGKNVCEKNPK